MSKARDGVEDLKTIDANFAAKAPIASPVFTGNVGIGTSSPDTPLDVTKAGAGNFVAKFQNTTAATPYGVWIKDAVSGANGYPLLQVTNSSGSTAHLKVMSGTGDVIAAGYIKTPKMATTYAMLRGPVSITNLTNSFTAMVVTNNPDSLYNAANGRFTCPVAGLYQMTFMSINNLGFSSTVQAYAFHNGSEIAGGSRMYESQDHNHGGSSATAIIQCASGDYLQWRASGSIYSGKHSGASFMLVHAS